MRWRVLANAMLSIALLLTLQRVVWADETPLVADLANPIVEISYAFSGAELLVFGATECVQDQTGSGCHLVAIVEGPAVPATVRRKERKNGLWVNGAAQTFQDAPSYYAFAASAPIDEIVNPDLAAALALGLPEIPLARSSQDKTDIAEETGFRDGLISDRMRKGLYVADQQTIIVREGRLFRMSFSAPATVPTGTYSVRIYAIAEGAVIAQTRQSLLIRKAGFEAFVSRAAKNTPLLYAIISVILALSIGFVSATAFKN